MYLKDSEGLEHLFKHILLSKVVLFGFPLQWVFTAEGVCAVLRTARPGQSIQRPVIVFPKLLRESGAKACRARAPGEIWPRRNTQLCHTGTDSQTYTGSLEHTRVRTRRKATIKQTTRRHNARQRHTRPRGGRGDGDDGRKQKMEIRENPICPVLLPDCKETWVVMMLLAVAEQPKSIAEVWGRTQTCTTEKKNQMFVINADIFKFLMITHHLLQALISLDEICGQQIFSGLSCTP